MTDIRFVLDDGYLRRPEKDESFAEAGEEVLRVTLPSGDAHLLSHPEGELYWDTLEGGVLEISDGEGDDAKVVRLYGQWVSAEGVRYKPPSPPRVRAAVIR